MCIELAGVDMKKFERWAVSFVSDCQSPTSGGRKVFLMYDGYRSHMGIRVLEILKAGGIIAYALPTHTSGKTQPLDVGAFGPFKQHLNRLIHETSEACAARPMDLFDLMKLMRSAYECAFPRSNIQKAFKKSGIWPLNPAAVLNIPRPISASAPSKIVTVQELSQLLEERRTEKRAGLKLQPVVLKRGSVDTTYGLNLTSQEAFELCASQVRADRARKAREACKAAEKEERERQEFEKTRKERQALVRRRLGDRRCLYNVPEILRRSFTVRRAIAKRRAMHRRSELSRMNVGRAAHSNPVIENSGTNVHQVTL